MNFLSHPCVLFPHPSDDFKMFGKGRELRSSLFSSKNYAGGEEGKD